MFLYTPLSSPTPQEILREDGYKAALKQVSSVHYSWLEWLRDLLIDFVLVLSAVLLVGLFIGHWKAAGDSETFATTKQPAKLVRRRRRDLRVIKHDVYRESIHINIYICICIDSVDSYLISRSTS